MAIRGYRLWRRLVGVLVAVVMLGLPFLKISGQSAFRFDIPSLRLFFFGTSIWIEEFFLVLVSLLFITFLIIWVTLVLGRVWCGWLCPQTVLSDFTEFAEGGRGRKGVAGRLTSWIGVFMLSALVGADLIWYFISPYEFIGRLITGDLGAILWGFWITLTGIVFLDLALVRRTFCKTVCPYAKMQSVLYDKATMVIAFDNGRADECQECRACVNTCPVNIDIREGLSPACINCAQCIDECTERMGRRGKLTLIDYSFGLPGDAVRVLRQNVAAIGLVTGTFLIFLIYLIVTRPGFETTVLRNTDFSPRLDVSGNAVNSFVLSFRNYRSSEIEISVDVSQGQISPGGLVRVSPGDMVKYTVYVTLARETGEGRVRPIEFVLSAGEGRWTMKREAKFLLPTLGDKEGT